MRTRTLIFLFLIAALLFAALFGLALSARRGELTAVRAVREFYVAWLARTNTYILPPGIENMVTTSLRDTLSGTLKGDTDGVLCGGGMPLQVSISDASVFWGEGGATVQLIGENTVQSSRVDLLYVDGRWLLSGISCRVQ